MPIQNQTLKQFMEEMVSLLVEKYPGKIVSFVLFGSATTGEWIRGKSDIDCIVLTSDKRLNKDIEDYLNRLVIELDKKYDLKLAETCTPYKKTNNFALDLIFKTESTMMFGRPFYVVSEDQLDTKGFKVRKDLKIEIGTRTVASIALFLKRIKNTGEILYGRDIRKEIPDSVPAIEKVKASFNAMLLLMMAYVILPFSVSSAFSHAIKANFWACDDVLFALEKPLSTTKKEIDTICTIFDRSEIESDHLYKSLEYKRTKDSLNLQMGFVAGYILKSTRFVYYLYGRALKKFLKVW
ncbi:MAG: nucleotidyltransferase domain-containing protein [Nitrosopumilaceae archaeon]|nr:nucleotidyltransferase domain-containing protein [Nitrosopumilaceae archaeon]NIU01036.1 nucleotidyltransferase domain-containing protein [Nitrosopumilaceae archaeon]NIU87470.1 nucleotidyltransferase domain-containing protein [Nitrosopumilaceae archaeon]NIV65519.1 nucleotidyltransferase domain-containing protein [Nitrosopumilaceae archaeon]NIX61638.1 nucleotidyltransferase domain-containing protein [Nitrosopumilaceae archaeon]